MSEIIKLNQKNIASEHICCAISDKKTIAGYEAKKQWLAKQFDDGFVFKKLDVRGKVFIEYVPAESAWSPIDAPNYMFINSCFWVAGQFKGKGYGQMLYEECLKDSKDKNGLVVVSSLKKQPYLSDKKFFQKQGFELCDKAAPYFELWYKKLNKNAPAPKFKDCAKTGECDKKDGLVVYYSNGCPYTEFYVKDLEAVAAKRGYKLTAIKIATREQAQNHFVPHTIYSVFLDGKFVTQHVLNENSFDKFIKQL